MKKPVRWIDEYTSPRETTDGNLPKANYFQAFLQGGTEGYFLMGPPGIAAGAGSALMGTLTQNKTGNELVGLLAGTATGVGLGVAVGALSGQPLLDAGILGGLLGGFQTTRAHANASVRDSGAAATMLGALAIEGPAKMAGGLGAAAGGRMEKGWQRALVGVGVGASLGAGLAAVGFAPLSVPLSAAAGGITGGVGPFFGPRFSQLFRNLSEDSGKGMECVGLKTGLAKGPMDPRHRNALGAVPAAFVKEGLRGFLYSDGGWQGLVLGGAIGSVQQANIMYASQSPPKDEKDERG